MQKKNPSLEEILQMLESGKNPSYCIGDIKNKNVYPFTTVPLDTILSILNYGKNPTEILNMGVKL